MGLTTFLNGGTAVQLRGVAFLALTETGQVGAGAITDDSGGGGFTTWTYAGTVACRVDPMAGDESIVASRLSDNATHLITTPVGTAMTVKNRFLIANRGTYEVTAVQDRTASPLMFFEAIQVS